MLSQIIIFFILLFGISSFYVEVTEAKASNSLSRGFSMSVKDASDSKTGILISLDKTFTCGFLNSGANAYWFAIWFTNSKDKTVVWMANRDNPVNGRGSKLTLNKHGALVLTDLDGSIALETNTTFTNVVKAELLNSGNLVLKDPNDHILWQSFDSPTDTLLPSQKFTRNTRLKSKISPQMFGTAYFTLLFDNDNVLKLIYDGPEISTIYWPEINSYDNVFAFGRRPDNSSRIAVLDDIGYFKSSDTLTAYASDKGIGIKRRLTVDSDGNLRLYSLNESLGSWLVTWQAMMHQCSVHGLCGENAICAFMPQPRCSCPPYYEPVNSTDWTKGCKPSFKRSCSDSHFIEVHHVDYFGYDINSTKASFEECRQFCLDDCRCKAFGYRKTGEAMCFTKVTLFNGYRSNNFPGTMYLRVPKMAQASESVGLNVPQLHCGSSGKSRVLVLNTQYDTSSQKFNLVYVYYFIAGIGAIEFIMLVTGWLVLFRKHGVSNSLEDGYRAISSQFRCFSYNELKKATGNFKKVLGRGGFGDVYKGVLKDEREVAIKKLVDVIHGEEEFWAEVSTIAQINHMNLARMWGFCSERKKRLLVYEYIENGSLDKHLFSSSMSNNTSFLEWNDRFKIALGTAKGLAYLHHECLEWVIHCDVKPENILLDADFAPKISDFGLSKLCQRDGSGTPELTRIRGTKGYMAPEWTTNLPITAKVDVYSYGVVILELIRGVRFSGHREERDEELMELSEYVSSVKSKIQSREDPLWIEELVDPKLGGKFSRKQAAVMIQAGLLCVEYDRNRRPTMESVAQILAECEDEIATM